MTDFAPSAVAVCQFNCVRRGFSFVLAPDELLRVDAIPIRAWPIIGNEIMRKVIINDTMNFVFFNCNQHFGNLTP